MSNLFLAWQNRTDEGTLSGGSWLSTLPLTNLQNRQVQKVARSTNVAVASTQFQLDLGVARSISALALVLHNISVSGEVRITGADNSAAFTNLLTSSRDLTNAAWLKTNITVTANSITAPDGTVTAAKVAATAAGTASLSQSVGASGTSVATEVFVKQGSSPTGMNAFLLRNISTSTDLISGTIDYSTGVATVVGGSGAMTVQSAGGDGWWKVKLSSSSGIAVGNAITLYVGAANTTVAAGDYMYAFAPNAVNGLGASYDSTWTRVWPDGVVPQDRLEWENDNFWSGALSQEMRSSYQSPYICKLSSPTLLRYWLVEISDTINPVGYVQIGRLFVAAGWTPNVNYAYNWGLGFNDPTPVDVSLSGAEYFDVRPKFRTLNLSLDYITQTEAYNYVLDLQRIAGISGEVLVMPDGGDDLSQQPVISFVGRLKQLAQVSQPNPTAYSTKFEIKELL